MRRVGPRAAWVLFCLGGCGASTSDPAESAGRAEAGAPQPDAGERPRDAEGAIAPDGATPAADAQGTQPDEGGGADADFDGPAPALRDVAVTDADSAADAGGDGAPDAAVDAAADAAPPPAPVGFEEFDEGALARLRTLSLAGGPPDDTSNRFAENDAAATLGQRLFFAPTLSPRGLDCAFCHRPEGMFSSALSYDGAGGLGFRNAPSLVGVAWQRWFFWDGRADSAWAQVSGPLEAADELGTNRVRLARDLGAEPRLRDEYEALFGPLPDLRDSARFPADAKPSAAPEEAALDAAWRSMEPEDQAAVNGVLANVGKALAAYERRLVGGTSAFDAFLRAVEARDSAAAALYPEAARRGLGLFIGRAGCFACHSGPTLSDGEFHNLGLESLEPRVPLDPGRREGAALALADPFNALGAFSDDRAGAGARRLRALVVDDSLEGRFRTPSVRNVALTGPWGHDGRFRALADVVRFKSDADSVPGLGVRDPLLQPLGLTDDEVADLVAFLESLTDAPFDPALTAAPP